MKFQVFFSLAALILVPQFISAQDDDLGRLLEKRQAEGGAHRYGHWTYRDFRWPKVDGKAVLAYWPSENIDKIKMQQEGKPGDLNDSIRPRAREVCMGLGFDDEAGYRVYEPYKDEWDVEVFSDGSTLDRYMRPEYTADHYSYRWFSHGVFELLSCKRRNN